VQSFKSHGLQRVDRRLDRIWQMRITDRRRLQVDIAGGGCRGDEIHAQMRMGGGYYCRNEIRDTNDPRGRRWRGSMNATPRVLKI